MGSGNYYVFGPGPFAFMYLGAIYLTLTLWWGLVGTRLTWRRER